MNLRRFSSVETVENVGVRPLSERAPAPTLRDGIVAVERTVHDGGPDFRHQMRASRIPTHLLLSIHSSIQQPLHRALGNDRQDWCFTLAAPRIVDGAVQGSGGSCSFGKGRAGIGDPIKSVPEPGAERAGVDCVTNLEQ